MKVFLNHITFELPRLAIAFTKLNNVSKQNKMKIYMNQSEHKEFVHKKFLK